MVVYSEQFAAALRDHLGDRSQSAVAQAAGCDRATLNRMVRQGRVPSRELLAKVADALPLTGQPRRELFAAAGYVELEAAA